MLTNDAKFGIVLNRAWVKHRDICPDVSLVLENGADVEGNEDGSEVAEEFQQGSYRRCYGG